MSDLWAAIDTTRSPNPRLLVTNAGKEPILKARMSGPPQHRSGDDISGGTGAVGGAGSARCARCGRTGRMRRVSLSRFLRRAGSHADVFD